MSPISIWSRRHWRWAAIVILALLAGSLAPGIAKPVAADSSYVTISGHVYEPDGETPLPNFYVHAHEGAYDFGAMTDQYGFYSIPVLPGSYTVPFGDPSSRYVDGCYKSGASGNFTVDQGTCSAVDATSNATLPDVVLQLAMHISGHVYGPDGKTPLPNVQVLAYDFARMTDQYGFYSIPVLPGSYTVSFYDPSSRYVDGCYESGASGNFTADQNACSAVDATSNATLPDVAMPLGMHISGHVYGPDGQGLANISVNAWPSAGGWDGTSTGAGGAYLLTVPSNDTYTIYLNDDAGTYLPGFYSSSGFTINMNASTRVPVATSDVTGIDVQMQAGLHISGRVTAADGATPLPNVNVNAGIMGTGDFSAGATTGPDGTYSVLVAPNADYTVWFHDNAGAYIDTCYSSGGSGGNQGCSDVRVGAADVTGIDAQMMLGVHITGTVTGPGGKPLAGVSVMPSSPFGAASTTADGTYSVTVPAGRDYSVTYESWGWTNADGSAYPDGCYSSTAPGHFTTDSNACTPVTVGTSNITGIDVQLQVGLRIKGRVTGPDGSPVEHVDIHAGMSFTNPPNAPLTGDYSLTVLPGTYTVSFIPNNGVAGPSGCYSSTAPGHFTTDQNACTPVTVTDSDVTGIDVQMGLSTLDHLVLDPASATITAGGTQPYRALGFDASGNSLGDVTSDTTFTIGGGGSCSGASCSVGVAGDYTVTGTDGAATGTGVLHVILESQSITFLLLSDQTYGAGPIALTATASSGLAVSYAATGTCTVSADSLTLTGAGTCSVTASQGGDSSWAAATPVTRIFTILPAPLTVAADAKSKPLHSPNPALTWTGIGWVNGDGPSSLTTQPTCTTTATAGSPLGTYPITCSGAVDPNYTISYVQGSLTVVRIGQTISFAPLGDRWFYQSPFTVSATASSGLAVTFTTLTPSVCTTSGKNGTTITLSMKRGLAVNLAM